MAVILGIFSTTKNVDICATTSFHFYYLFLCLVRFLFVLLFGFRVGWIEIELFSASLINVVSPCVILYPQRRKYLCLVVWLFVCLFVCLFVVRFDTFS
jgi:hypothetical protein